MCAKLIGIFLNIDFKSKLFHSYCCSFNGNPLLDLLSEHIGDISLSESNQIHIQLAIQYLIPVMFRCWVATHTGQMCK